MAPTSKSTSPRSALRRRRGTLAQLGDLGRAQLDEALGDRLLDQHALGAHADLPAVREPAPDRGVRRARQVGVGQHQHRRLAAQLEHDRDQRSPASRAICRPTFWLPVKKIMSTCAAQRLADVALPGSTWKTPSGRPSSRHSACDAQRGQRRPLRRLEHHGVAAHQRRDAVGEVVEQRPVPGPDHPDHAARVVDDARALVARTRTGAADRRAARAARRGRCSSGSARRCRRARSPRPRSAACRSRRPACRAGSASASMRWVSRRSARARSANGSAPQAGCAARARATACSTSAAVADRDLGDGRAGPRVPDPSAEDAEGMMPVYTRKFECGGSRVTVEHRIAVGLA